MKSVNIWASYGQEFSVSFLRHGVELNRLSVTGTHTSYGITQCYLPPGRRDILALTQAQLVLDLATQKGRKAELTTEMVNPPKVGHPSEY